MAQFIGILPYTTVSGDYQSDPMVLSDQHVGGHVTFDFIASGGAPFNYEMHVCGVDPLSSKQYPIAKYTANELGMYVFKVHPAYTEATSKDTKKGGVFHEILISDMLPYQFHVDLIASGTADVRVGIGASII